MFAYKFSWTIRHSWLDNETDDIFAQFSSRALNDVTFNDVGEYLLMNVAVKWRHWSINEWMRKFIRDYKNIVQWLCKH